VATLRGGQKLEAALKELSKKIEKKATLRVGFLEGATYPDGTPVAMVAAIQDFGAPGAGIPPRPFFRNMIAEKSPGWGPATGKLLVANNYDVDKTLSQVGEGIKGQLQQSIHDTNSPPLKPATIKRKGFDKPLVSTGHMLNSVDYDIKE
jgi:hypothetical protein